jgi:hypothetical protein
VGCGAEVGVGFTEALGPHEQRKNIPVRITGITLFEYMFSSLYIEPVR